MNRRWKVINYIVLIGLFIFELVIFLCFYKETKECSRSVISRLELLEDRINNLSNSIILMQDDVTLDLNYDWIGVARGYIAHGMGGVEGYNYTNSIEAFEKSYAKGIRVFEVDIHSTQEGSVVLYHDLESWHEMAKTKNELSYFQFMGKKLYSKYRPIDINDLCGLMLKYPDIYVIIDYGAPAQYENLIWYSNLVYWGNKYGILERFVIEIVDASTLSAAQSVFSWKSYVFAYYKEKWESDEDAIKFCLQNHIRAVNITQHQCEKYGYEMWIRNGIYVCVFTVNDKDVAEQFIANGVSAVYTDNLVPSKQ